MISNGITQWIFAWFRRTDGNIRYRPLIIRRTVIPVLCNSNYSGSFGILKVVNFPTVTSRTAIRTGTTNSRKFYRGGVLPELVISAETGTAARRESPRIMPENQVFKLRNFIIQSSLRFIICP